MALGRAYILILSYQIVRSVTSFEASPTSSAARIIHACHHSASTLLHNLCANVARTRNTPLTSIKWQTVDGSDAPETEFDARTLSMMMLVSKDHSSCTLKDNFLFGKIGPYFSPYL